MKPSTKPPTPEQYAAAFTKMGNVSDRQRQLLRMHYQAPERTITAKEMARSAALSSYRRANLHYGKLGHMIGAYLDYNPIEEHLGALVTFERRKNEWHWIMRPEVAHGLELSGLLEENAATADKAAIAAEYIDCQALLDSLDYENDIRNPPDRPRQTRFQAGWLDATLHGRTYRQRALNRLTWNNLGYRLGKLFGQASPAEIEAFFERFAAHYRSRMNYPDTVPDVSAEEEVTLREGQVRQMTVNVYERNPEARRRCIARHKAVCCICAFDFGATYGRTVAGFIHVHHLRQVADAGGEYKVNPIEDLRPVCPNCHAVIHSRRDAYSIQDVKTMMEAAKHKRNSRQGEQE